MGIEIYTDGAYASSINQGGACAAFVKDSKLITKIYEGFENTTNNRMEMYGVMLAFNYILLSDEMEFTIYTDSQYVLGILTRGNKRNVNRYIWKVVDKMVAQIKEKNKKIKYVWVKGHAGNEFNEVADTWAQHASHIKNVGLDKPYKNE